MILPAWIWFVFIFAFGCCIGSFLNVVIYRLPRDKSLIMPPSACPNCDKQIAFYDNIPLLSWLVLAGKCRHCKVPISARYFVIEFITALVFVGLFYIYFYTNIRSGIGTVFEGGWLIYMVHIVMLAAFLAASAIDLQLWVIPISICWLVAIVGLIASGVGGYVIDPDRISQELLLPTAGVKVASLAAGALVGLVIAWLLLASGLIKRSYEGDEQQFPPEPGDEEKEPLFNDRIEVCKEIVFLLPIIICSIAAYRITQIEAIANWWVNFSQHPVIAGLLGSLWGYFIGCGIVWATRILGTLGFGKEAMGLGDVHLMGAAGAVIGPVFVVIAFFIAPFFGLAWAFVQMFSKKIRQIPYGPFLSLGALVVIILHERILSYMVLMFYSRN